MNGGIRRLITAGSVAIAAAAGSTPAAAIDASVVRATRHLVAQQKSSGAFFSSDARADGVAEVVASLVAGGVRGAPIDRALAYMRTHGPEAASQPAYAGRIVMGIVAGGGNPRSFGGIDYVARIVPGANGSYAANLYGHALAALGVLAAGGRVPDAAMRHIRDHECPGGGFAYDPGCASAGNIRNALRANVDTTALVLCIFVASGVPPADEARSRARAFLVDAMNSEHGFGEYADEATSANSTGLVLSALAALGESPAAAPWRSDGRDPVSTLRSMQEPSGAFPPNNYATMQAIPGLAGVAYPVRPRITEQRGSTSRTTVAQSTPVPRSSLTTSVLSPSPAGVPSVVSVGSAPPRALTDTPRQPRRSGKSGVVAVAVTAGAAAAEGLRRGRKRWVASRAR